MKNIPQACRPSYLWFWPPLILGGSVISAGTIHDLRRVKVPAHFETPGHHYLPTYQILMISDNVELLRYCGDHFEKIFNGGNQFGTSLSTHISNFDDIRQCWIVAAILKMVAGRNFSMSGHHIYPHIKFWWYRAILIFCCPFFMPFFGSHFENGRHLENFENTELLL
jgi:hypothetical protein